jgi:hypothetical protein
MDSLSTIARPRCLDGVGAPQPNPVFAKKELFHEIDDRAGYYVGAQVRYLDRAVLNVLHYDNRGDPTYRRRRFAILPG